MEALRQAMAAKKRELSLIHAEKPKQKKYIRRGDAEAFLWQKEAAKEAEENSKKRKLDDNDDDKRQQQQEQKNDRTQTQQNKTGSDSEAAEASTEQGLELSWAETKRRLRDLGEPITLFGETATERIKRLRQAEHDAARREEDGLGAGHDIRNRFVGHGETSTSTALEQAQDRADDEDDAQQSREQAENEGGAAVEEDEFQLVYRFFKRMLQLWEKDLAERPDHVKGTAQGKIATKTMKQCKDYIRPLFKLCKQRAVPTDIMPNLIEIVRFCQAGEFVQANDAYIKLAIGNAAWPIGVTMVGIHERTGREKINSNKQAHVMNNESQRKYLTSVKRLISYCQSISDVLPSKKVS
ncbi:TPA: hypothetical protein N0F65_006479 [Lagenidium giganteum]|uniref:Pre-mRNA-splicing factor 18 n=1 Tax=Lagenidium giganteum TaxID=4803 RepID=A0AAV2YSV1_9STRA|nr:TPA: hypothetical protein N0F65_006479 [Lagenidium giganteum]